MKTQIIPFLQYVIRSAQEPQFQSLVRCLVLRASQNKIRYSNNLYLTRISCAGNCETV